MSRLLGLFDIWVPPSLAAEEDTSVRARSVVGVALTYCTGNALFALQLAVQGKWPLALWEGGIGAVVALVPWLLRRTARLDWAMHALGGILLVEAWGMLWQEQKLPPFLFATGAVLPMAARYLAGPKQVRFWLGMLLLQFGVMIAVGAQRGWPVEELSRAHPDFFFEVVIFVGILVTLGWAQQGLHNIALKKAAETQASLEAARAQAEEARARAEAAQAQAEEAARARTAFLTMMSHEIRTPLNGVIGLSRVLQDTVTEDERREMAHLIERSGDRLLRMLGNVLDLTQLESGGMRWMRGPVALERLARRVVEGARVGAEEKGLSLCLDWQPGTPAWVEGDEARLEQLLTTLLQNAVKFTPSGGVGLEVRAVEAGVAIEVWDTGTGIPPERLRELFRPFSQLDEGNTRRFEGAGVGLALCWRLTTGLGGEMRVVPRVGGGTRFLLSFPLRAVEAPHGGEGEAPAEGWGLRVLVVDDNPVNLKVASRLMERQGCKVVQATGGQEALERLSEGQAALQPVELVLMDCQMPEMDGFEATRRIRQAEGTRTHTPVVALTAGQSPQDRQQAFDAGMDAFLNKPLRVEQLAVILRRLGRAA